MKKIENKSKPKTSLKPTPMEVGKARSDKPKPKKGEAPAEKPVKKHKVGVITISNVPKDMTDLRLYEIMRMHSAIGCVYVQPKELSSFKTNNNQRKGWVEFISKSGAKKIARELNNKPITGNKSSPFYGLLWNMKFLPRFKWDHLRDRVKYEVGLTYKRLHAHARKQTALNNPHKSEFIKKQAKKAK
ncbi:pre-rRNA-processing protein esf2-like [Drosophila mauritiana]|uniref:Pre-rRNA-processing protein esf2-like n=1 Tax=Drosophila mauritiana TaxID=7226 RepID=A0A6P8KQF2_DROMA|nr:pre-rRNA-processing protein esf2-like [Drosophila mauritiana]